MPRGRCDTSVVGLCKEREPWGAHTQESSSLGKQLFPWVPTAVLRLRPWKAMEEEANAHSSPTSGRRGRQQRQQVDKRLPEAAPQGRRSPASSLHGDRLPRLPCPENSQAAGSRSAQTQIVVRDKGMTRITVVLQRDTVPRGAAAPAPWLQEPASTGLKMPPLPAAASAAPAIDWETAHSTAPSDHRQPVPAGKGLCGERGRAASARRMKLPPLSPTAVKDTAQSITNEVLCKVFNAGPGPRQQPVPPARDLHNETGRAMMARSMRLPPLSPTAVKTIAQSITSEVLCKVFSASAGARRQPVSARSRGGAPQTMEELWVADGGKTPAAQPTPEPEGWGSLAQAQRDLPTPAPIKSCRKRQPGSAEGTAAEDKPGALDATEWDNVTIRSIYINPSVSELFEDHDACPQEEHVCPSSLGTEGRAEEDGHLQSASPAPAGLADPEPAASAMAGGPEEEKLFASLAPEAQEETKAAVSPDLEEQTQAAECQAVAPRRPTIHEDALQEAALCVVREVVMNAELIMQSELAQSKAAGTAETTAEAPQDPESPLAAASDVEAQDVPGIDTLQRTPHQQPQPSRPRRRLRALRRAFCLSCMMIEDDD